MIFYYYRNKNIFFSHIIINLKEKILYIESKHLAYIKYKSSNNNITINNNIFYKNYSFTIKRKILLLISFKIGRLEYKL